VWSKLHNTGDETASGVAADIGSTGEMFFGTVKRNGDHAMARGRYRQSDALKALRGNPHGHKLELKRAAADAIPPPATPMPVEIPAFLTTERSREIFRRIIDDYLQNRIARRADIAAFGRWACYLDRWIDVKHDLDGRVLTYETVSKHGKLIRRHPDFQVMTDLERLLQSLEDRLGLNPIARQNYLRGLAALPAPLAGLFNDGREQKQTGEPQPDNPLGFLQRASTPKPN
jgi:P27 family predicted phage terminase small subunit